MIRIIDHPNYFITNSGHVVSNARKRTIVLKWLLTKGYAYVSLDSRRYLVHRLVAKHFLPGSYKDSLCINHIDANKLNNCVYNLEVCTQKENMHHAIKLGLINYAWGERTNTNKLSIHEVSFIKRELIGNLPNTTIARMFGVNKSTINRIKNGITWRKIYE